MSLEIEGQSDKEDASDQNDEDSRLLGGDGEIQRESEGKRKRVEMARAGDVYLGSWLGEEFALPKQRMTEELRKKRNIGIVLSIIEFVCCIGSVGFYVRERSRLILGVICVAAVAAIIGSWARLCLSWWGLFIHAATTIAVIGAFTIYSVVDSFLSSDHEPMEGLGKGVIVFLSTLPMLFLFLMGVYSLILLLLVDEELERRKKARRLRVDPADPGNR